MIPTKNWKIPTIAVYVTVMPSDANALRENYTWRVGVCHSEEQIFPMIEQDVKALRNTLGGLLSAVDVTGRTYHAYRATWSDVEFDESTCKAIDALLSPPKPPKRARARR